MQNGLSPSNRPLRHSGESRNPRPQAFGELSRAGCRGWSGACLSVCLSATGRSGTSRRGGRCRGVESVPPLRVTATTQWVGMPARAGMDCINHWIPACAGMTAAGTGASRQHLPGCASRLARARLRRQTRHFHAEINKNGLPPGRSQTGFNMARFLLYNSDKRNFSGLSDVTRQSYNENI